MESKLDLFDKWSPHKIWSTTSLLTSKWALANSLFKMTKDIWMMCVSYWKNDFKLDSILTSQKWTNQIGSRRWCHEFHFFNNSRRNAIQMFVLAAQITLLSSLNLIFNESVWSKGSGAWLHLSSSCCSGNFCSSANSSRDCNFPFKNGIPFFLGKIEQ